MFKRWMRAAGGAVLLCAVSIVPAGVPAAADSIRDHQWALSSLDAEAMAKVSTGRGVTVAVVDTGVDGTHPDLKGNVLSGKNFIMDHGRADRETESSHGTGMASLIAGHGHGPGGRAGIKGLAPAAKILPLRANTDNNMQVGKVGRGGPVAQAIRYAADHGASVINLSLGSPDDPALEDAVRYARQKDVVMVAAAGNDGAGTPNFPANYPGVISVGAVDSSDKIWHMSNYGSHTLLSAPGVGTYNAGLDHEYQVGDGTSGASAFVSATAALLRAKFPDLTAGQIANRLVKTAKLSASVKGAKLPDKHYGYGVIRPYGALTEDIPPGSKNGPFSAPSASPSAAPEPPGSAEPDAPSRKGQMTFVVWGLVGVAVLGLLAVVTVVVVKRRRRAVPPPPLPPLPPPFGQQPPGPDVRQ
ncbi:type VII secretion-associated serine protease mycosin [Streptomyces sp. Edi2]|uniref:type VII secretion-associated serine protease mycosin n=1 Tax=Streptomyces sp. Edi2 TaxID=3162528 RepID=UPI003305AAE9